MGPRPTRAPFAEDTTENPPLLHFRFSKNALFFRQCTMEILETSREGCSEDNTGSTNRDRDRRSRRSAQPRPPIPAGPTATADPAGLHKLWEMLQDLHGLPDGALGGELVERRVKGNYWSQLTSSRHDTRPQHRSPCRYFVPHAKTPTTHFTILFRIAGPKSFCRRTIVELLGAEKNRILQNPPGKYTKNAKPSSTHGSSQP